MGEDGGFNANSATDGPELIAYRVRSSVSLDLVPAAQGRDWIDATNERFARRCLPLLIANQAGWFLVNRRPIRAIWDGGDEASALRVESEDASVEPNAISHFGHGILTWHVPYVFRTPPGWNLLARGPANWPKDGVSPLEGVVETDWAIATFSMNWKMTAIDRPVTFEAGEPVCMIVPQRRGELEGFRPIIRCLGDDPVLERAYRGWDNRRQAFIAALRVPGSVAEEQGWERDYFRGDLPGGISAPEHQTRLRLAAFDDPAGICGPDSD